MPVQRRYGNTTPDASRRQITVLYRLMNEEGETVHVCRGTFMNNYGISKKGMETFKNKKKIGNESVAECH